MNAVTVAVEVLWLLSALAALGLLLVYRGRGLALDSRFFLGAAALASGVAAFGGGFSRPGLLPEVSFLPAEVQMLVPVFWGLFFYSRVQHRRRRRESRGGQDELFLRNMPHAAFLKNSDSSYIHCNASFARMMGLEASQIIGKSDVDLFGEQLARRFRSEDRRVLETGEEKTFFSQVDLKGKQRVYHVTKAPATDRNGEVVGVLGVIRNATDSPLSRPMMQRTREKLDRVVEHLKDRVFVKGRDLRFLYANEPFAADLGVRPAEVRGKSDADFFPPELAAKYAEQDRQVMTAGKICSQEVEWEEGPVGHCTQQWTKVPIRDGDGEVVALMGIAAWREKDRAARQVLSHWASLAMSSADAVMGLDPEGKVLSWNSTAEKMYGYREQEVQGRPITFLSPEKRGDEVLRQVLRAADGESIRRCETVHLDRRGEPIDISLALSPLTGPDGRISGVSVVARDVSERKRAEEALRESERRHRLTLDAIRDMVIVVNEQLEIVLTNSTALKWGQKVGLAVDSFEGENVFDAFPFFTTRQRRRVRAEFHHVFETAETVETQRKVEANGREVVLETRKMPVPEGERVTRVLTIVRDVTERVEAERSLARIEREEAAVLNAMSESVICYGADGQILWANHAAAQAVEATREELVGRQCYHGLNEDGQSCPECPFGQGPDWADLPLETETEAPDGRIWWVRGYPVYDDEGEAEGVVNVALDVTVRKQLEQNMARWVSVVEATDDAIIQVTPDGVVQGWNRGAEKIYGHAVQEIRGRKLSSLAVEERREELQGLIRKVAAGHRVQQHESLNRTKDDRTINVSLTMSPIRGEDGGINGVSVIVRDITDHVALRDELINLSLVDSLTGLNNRRGFFHLAKQQLKVARRTENHALLIFADLDGMKKINDTLGHKAGDRALLEAAEVLRETFRESDIIGRIGGDEFAVLALEAEPGEEEEIINRLQRELDRRNEQPDRTYSLDMSRGVVACGPDNPVPLEKLVAEADSRMYEHKKSKTHWQARSG